MASGGTDVADRAEHIGHEIWRTWMVLRSSKGSNLPVMRAIGRAHEGAVRHNKPYHRPARIEANEALS